MIDRVCTKIEGLERNKKGQQSFYELLPCRVEPNVDTANKFNEHLELILDFMGVLDHEPELMEKIKSSENTETKMNKI